MSKDNEGTIVPEVAQLLKAMIQRQDDTNAALKALAERQDDTNAALKALAGDVRGIRTDLQAGLAKQDQH